MSYSSEVLADSPLAYYRLGESSGTTMVDSSGNGRNGAYVGSPTLGTPGLQTSDADTAGTFGVGYGQTDYGVWAEQAAFTIEAIIKPSSTVGSGVVAARHTAGAASWMLRRDDATLRLWFNPWTALSSATVLEVGATYHVAATYDGTTRRLYINGALDSSAAVGAFTASAAGLSIGANFGNFADERFAGVVDEVAYYSGALSAARVAAHYAAATASGDPSGTLGVSLPVPTVDLAGTYTAPDPSGTLTLTLPTPEVALTGAYTPAPGTGFLAATLPVPTVELTGTYTAPAVRTDTTTDVSLGYGYDGYATVGDDLTAGAIPPGIHLPPIVRVHQSLPAPTLVDGRPT